MSFDDYFKYGACSVINASESACASHFLTQNVPVEELFFVALSKVYGKTEYDPFLVNGGQSLIYVQQKYGYLLDFVLTLGGIIGFSELLIFIKKYVRI